MNDESNRTSSATPRLSHKVERYVTFTNDTVRDKRLSWEALGLLVNLLSHAEGWKIRIEDFTRPHTGNGRDAVARAMRQLEELGYLERTRRPDATGRLVPITVLHYPPREVPSAHAAAAAVPVGGHPVTGLDEAGHSSPQESGA